MAEISAAAGSAASAGLAGMVGAGTQAAAVAGSGGASGLFTQFIGAATPAGAGTPATALTATAGAVLPQAAQGLVSLPLAQGSDLQVSGTSQDMSVLVQRVDVVVQTLQKAGISLDQLATDGPEQLAAALQVLGMSPEEAQAMAERIEAALKTAKAKLDAADGDMGMLAALMLAGTQAPALPALPEETSIQVSVTTVQLDVQVVSAQVGHFRASHKADAARDMVLSGGAGAAAGGMVLAEDVAEGPLDSLALEFEMGTDGAVMRDADGNVTVLAQPAVATVAAPVDGAVAGFALSVENKATTPVEKVLEKPKGDVMYVWRPDDLGVEQVKPTQEAHKSMENLLGLGASGMVGMAEAGAAGASTLGNFSDRLAAAMRHDVVQQTSIQMQKLGDQGGGQVRMVLNPPELGEIQIDLTVKDGAVHGSISAQDGAVVELLAKEVQNLRQGLADAGLKVGQEGISLMLSNNGQQHTGQQGQQTHEGRGGAGVGGVALADDGTLDAIPALDPAAWVSPDRLVDVRV